MKEAPPRAHNYHPGRHLQVMDDPMHDPYRDQAKLSEPCVCSDCGAVYHDGHWQWITQPANAHQTRCTACRRIHEQMPAGYVTVAGKFAHDHRAELISVARNLEIREKAEHPLQRIISIEDRGDTLMITTTDIHLARGIGEALKRAYKGELDFHYNNDQYLLRVLWRR